MWSRRLKGPMKQLSRDGQPSSIRLQVVFVYVDPVVNPSSWERIPRSVLFATLDIISSRRYETLMKHYRSIVNPKSLDTPPHSSGLFALHTPFSHIAP